MKPRFSCLTYFTEKVLVITFWKRGCIEPHQSGGWELELTHSCPQFRYFQRNLKEFKPYTGISKLIKPLQLVGQVAYLRLSPSLRLQAPEGHLAIILKGLPSLFQKTSKFLDCRINGQALGAELQHCLGRTGEHKHRAYQSLWQWLRAATGLLEEKCYQWCNIDLVRESKGLMFCKFGQWRRIFFHVKWNFRWSSNATTRIDKRTVVKDCCISCLALICNLSNPRMTILR